MKRRGGCLLEIIFLIFLAWALFEIIVKGGK